MYITGLLVERDDEFAVIKQAMTGLKYVCSLKDLQVERIKGKVVRYGGKASVRTYYEKCCFAKEIRKVGNCLEWKTVWLDKFVRKIL